MKNEYMTSFFIIHHESTTRKSLDMIYKTEFFIFIFKPNKNENYL